MATKSEDCITTYKDNNIAKVWWWEQIPRQQEFVLIRIRWHAASIKQPNDMISLFYFKNHAGLIIHLSKRRASYWISGWGRRGRWKGVPWDGLSRPWVKPTYTISSTCFWLVVAGARQLAPDSILLWQGYVHFARNWLVLLQELFMATSRMYDWGYGICWLSMACLICAAVLFYISSCCRYPKKEQLMTYKSNTSNGRFSSAWAQSRQD